MINPKSPKKTVLFNKAKDYLDYKVTREGLALTDKFIRTLRNEPSLFGPKEFATALGCFGYYW